MAKKKKKEDFKVSSKVYSQLRMIANGSNEVNAIRSISNKCVVARKETFKEVTSHVDSDIMSGYQDISAQSQQKVRAVSRKIFEKEKLEKDPPTEILTNIFIDLKSSSTWNDVLTEIYPGKKAADIKKRIVDYRVCGNLIKATVVMNEIKELTKSTHILSIEGSQSVLTPPPTRFFLSDAAAPKEVTIENKEIQTQSSEVLIGIIDVGGFDYAHPDFLDEEGKTRFLGIWDQGGVQRKPPSKRIKLKNNRSNPYFAKLDYGSFISREDMNDAIAQAPIIKAPIHSIEPQSQQSPSSHATHVASIAAGNSGICKNSNIIGVLISIPKDNDQSIESERASTFTDSSRITDAFDFLVNFAKQEGKPISINISLGTNGHAHDGSSAVNRWMDSQLSTEGKSVCIAAGNAGQEKGTNKDDFGYIMGRIHSSGKITNKGLMTDLEWHVIGNGIRDVSENEMEIWYEPQDRFSVMVKPPGMPWIGPVAPQQFIENQQIEDLTFVSIYNKIFHPANGNNHIGIYISPNLNKNSVIGITSGLWKVRLIGEEIRDGSFDAWIERDTPFRRSQEFWNFPSFFSESTNVDNKSINSLACGQNVIAVGNFDTENDKINITSSQGPSRDNRKKPEIVAPGTDIVAANGFAGAQSLWTAKTGTSMASPYACGVAGLLLSIQPQLTSSQIAGIFKRTCTPVTGFNYDWKNDTGFGILNIDACIEEANKFMKHEDLTPD